MIGASSLRHSTSMGLLPSTSQQYIIVVTCNVLDKLAIRFVLEELKLSNRVQNESSVMNARDLVVASQDSPIKFALVIFDVEQGGDRNADKITGADGFKKSLLKKGFQEQRPKLVLLKSETRKLKSDSRK